MASGPHNIPDATTLADAKAVLKRYGIVTPPSVEARLDDAEGPGPRARRSEPAPAARRAFIAAPQGLARSRGRRAPRRPDRPLILGDAIEGEASEVAKAMAGIKHQGRRFMASRPRLLSNLHISGGETTVTVKRIGPRRAQRRVPARRSQSRSMGGPGGLRHRRRH